MIKRTTIVKAVVFDGHNQVLLVRRSKTAPRRPLEWDLPGGFVDEDNGSYGEACLRELREETGLEVAASPITLGYAESNLDKLSKEEIYDMSWLYFLVKATDMTVCLSYEHDKSTWVSMERALQLIKYDRQLRALSHIRKVQQLQ